jgi:Acetyl-coenzyme A synthetase N-terminus
MPSEQTIYEPDQKLARSAYVSSFAQYQEQYKESIEQPEKFWSSIAKQFHWETPADPSNFMSYNFDISKGPISIKWMEGASTNICYNLLDRNIKNGHGDKIAFFWYVLVFKLSVSRDLSQSSDSWVEKKHLTVSLIFHPRARTFPTHHRRHESETFSCYATTYKGE